MSFTFSRGKEYIKDAKFLDDIPLTQKKLLIVEGNDEIAILELLCKSLNITDMHFHNLDGKDNLKKHLPVIKNSRVMTQEKLESIGIILDADTEPPSKTFDKAKTHLKKTGFNDPDSLGEFSTGNPKVGVYVLPDLTNPGSLEDLLLKSVDSDPKMNCVSQFYECAHAKGSIQNKTAKIKARAFILTTLSSRNGVYNSIGQAAHGNKWDFNSAAFERLKKFLQEL